MGELIRAKDWSKTSLGDPTGWPQSRRTMVAVMLDNPFEMYIAGVMIIPSYIMTVSPHTGRY